MRPKRGRNGSPWTLLPLSIRLRFVSKPRYLTTFLPPFACGFIETALPDLHPPFACGFIKTALPSRVSMLSAFFFFSISAFQLFSFSAFTSKNTFIIRSATFDAA